MFVLDAPFAVSGTAQHVPVVTAEFKINSLRPALGERLVVRARAVHEGKTQAVCRCEVFAVTGMQGKLCAITQGTIMKLPDVANEAEKT